MAERLAFLLAFKTEERLRLYRDTKKIYAMRSAVVHGSYMTRGKKEIPWADRLLVSPKYLVAGNSDLRLATNLLVGAINAFMSSPELMKIIGQKSDDEPLRHYFESMIFGHQAALGKSDG